MQRDYDTSIPEFRGDREQLIQAVLNIVRNATEALAEQIAAGSARLVLRTRIARQVTIGKQRYRLALELHVEDNGPGVPEAIRDRIFHPAGIGARRRLGTRADAGADLRATTPGHDRVRQRARTDHLQDPHSLALTPAASTDRMKPIWIVDDDHSIRFVLEKALAREQFAVRSFASAREVLAALDDEEPQVLVSDIRMPGGSGIDLLAQGQGSACRACR